LNKERLLLRGVVLVCAVIATQLNEEHGLPKLTSHCLNIIKDGHHRVLAIGIIVYTFPNVGEHTGEKLLSLDGYLITFTPTNLKKLDPPLNLSQPLYA
jgi:hypothetical protein